MSRRRRANCASGPAPARHGAAAARARGPAAGLPRGRRRARPAARRARRRPRRGRRGRRALGGASVADASAASAREYERFGTATVRTPGQPLDFATTRRRPTPSRARCRRWSRRRSPRTSRRRDFTDQRDGGRALRRRPRAPLRPHGRARRPRRRPHPGAPRRSFLDDPTRLLRAVRYAARLGFALEPETERRRARRSRRTPCRRCLARDPGRADGPARRARGAGRDRAHARARDRYRPPPGARPGSRRSASAALGAAAIGADRALAALAALIVPRSRGAGSVAGRLQLDARERDARRARRAWRRASRRRSASASTRPRSCTRCSAASRSRRWHWRWRWARRRADPALGDRPARRPPRDHRRRPARGRRARRARRSGARWRRRSTAEARRTRVRARRGARTALRSPREHARVRLPGADGDLLDSPGRGERGAVRVAQPGHPHRRRPGAGDREPRRAAARRASTPSGWRWAGRCTARTSTEWNGPPPDRGYARAGRQGPREGGRPCHPRARPRPARAGGRLLPGRAVGRRAGGDAPLRLAPAGRRDHREGGRRVRRRRPPPRSGRASAAAATRSGRRCWRRSRASRELRPAACSTCAAVIAAQLAAAGVVRLEHVDRCTSCSPDLYFSHRRDNGVTGRQAGIIVRMDPERVRRQPRAGARADRPRAWRSSPPSSTCEPTTCPALAEAGIELVGENRAQELLAKQEATATCSRGTSSARSRAARSRTWRRTCG